ncbi:MAG: hypothetical protein ACO1OQ_03205 [Rufibacter sp.]
MKPLIVLICVFLLALLAGRLIQGKVTIAHSGRIAMAAMLFFTALGHFLYAQGMSKMIPAFLPFKTGLVYLTGFLEIVFGVLLLVRGHKRTIGWVLIAFFVALLPANIYAALHHLDYQTGRYEGNGPEYLWFRIPLQVLFMVWVYVCVVYERTEQDRKI